MKKSVKTLLFLGMFGVSRCLGEPQGGDGSIDVSSSKVLERFDLNDGVHDMQGVHDMYQEEGLQKMNGKVQGIQSPRETLGTQPSSLSITVDPSMNVLASKTGAKLTTTQSEAADNQVDKDDDEVEALSVKPSVAVTEEVPVSAQKTMADITLKENFLKNLKDFISVTERHLRESRVKAIKNRLEDKIVDPLASSGNRYFEEYDRVTEALKNLQADVFKTTISVETFQKQIVILRNAYIDAVSKVVRYTQANETEGFVRDEMISSLKGTGLTISDLKTLFPHQDTLYQKLRGEMRNFVESYANGKDTYGTFENNMARVQKEFTNSMTNVLKEPSSQLKLKDWQVQKEAAVKEREIKQKADIKAKQEAEEKKRQAVLEKQQAAEREKQNAAFKKKQAEEQEQAQSQILAEQKALEKQQQIAIKQQFQVAGKMLQDAIEAGLNREQGISNALVKALEDAKKALVDAKKMIADLAVEKQSDKSLVEIVQEIEKSIKRIEPLNDFALWQLDAQEKDFTSKNSIGGKEVLEFLRSGIVEDLGEFSDDMDFDLDEEKVAESKDIQNTYGAVIKAYAEGVQDLEKLNETYKEVIIACSKGELTATQFEMLDEYNQQVTLIQKSLADIRDGAIEVYKKNLLSEIEDKITVLRKQDPKKNTGIRDQIQKLVAERNNITRS